MIWILEWATKYNYCMNHSTAGPAFPQWTILLKRNMSEFVLFLYNIRYIEFPCRDQIVAGTGSA